MRRAPGQLRLTCCLLLRGRLHWAKKASPRRGPSSPPVYWHLQQPFRPSHSRRWRSRHPLRHPLHRHRLHRHRLHPHPLHPHPRRLATMKLALPPGRALRQKPTSCSALHFSPCAANWRDDKASTPRGVGWWCHLLHFTLIRPTCQRPNSPIHASKVLRFRAGKAAKDQLNGSGRGRRRKSKCCLRLDRCVAISAGIAEPCGVHLPELAEIFVKKPAG